MREYEVRILSRTGEAIIKDFEFHLTDIAAINWGRRLAQGTRYEVWRDGTKIFPAPIPRTII
jgi:hypothetical protein